MSPIREIREVGPLFNLDPPFLIWSATLCAVARLSQLGQYSSAVLHNGLVDYYHLQISSCRGYMDCPDEDTWIGFIPETILLMLVLSYVS